MVELARKTITVNILDVETALRIDQFEVEMGGTDEEMVEDAISLVEGKGYHVVRDSEGGCCEATHYSDGTVAVAVTVKAE